MQTTNNHRQVIVNKPWGYEYLMYENEQVALWLLHIKQNHKTSLHCHPTKTTGLVLIDGEAEISFITDKKIINAPEKQMIRRGLFHSTKALSKEGIFMFEIETPKDKNDLVRLSDEYGREHSGYEKDHHEIVKRDDCVWLEDLKSDKEVKYNINSVPFYLSRSCDLNFLSEINDNDIIIFLKGGLGKIIDDRKHLATIPGDVGRVSVIKRVAREMDFLEQDTLFIRVPV